MTLAVVFIPSSLPVLKQKAQLSVFLELSIYSNLDAYGVVIERLSLWRRAASSKTHLLLFFSCVCVCVFFIGIA